MDPNPEPRLSVIIPVFCEEHVIGPLLDDLRMRVLRTKAEILVVDGDPQQRTLDALAGRDVVGVASAAGRARQMNLGAGQARGGVLLFLHADTRLPPAADTAIFRSLENPAIVGGAFRLAIDSPIPALALIAAAANLRNRVTRAPYGDQAIFLRRERFMEVGGYANLPLMEDLDLMHRIRRRGWPITLLPEPASTSGRRWEREGVWRCTLRNWGIRLLYHCGVPAARLARLYRFPGVAPNAHANPAQERGPHQRNA